MASYFPNIPDYIPQIAPFQPDLNFYANVLAAKQSQYDQGLKQISSVYTSVLNSPMMAEDNIARRSNYFKTIEQDVQKIAQMDLSLDQNVQTAEKLFDPILNDKDIVNDIVQTRKVGKSYERGQQLRNCADPDKCGGEYWDVGTQALNYWVDEFKAASPADRLRMKAPDFVPRQNVMRKAVEAAKNAGFDVSYEYTNGRYNITDKNGALLLDRRDAKGNIIRGVLPQFLYGLFGEDKSIQDMFATEAYVKRKNFVANYSAQTGADPAAAESFYMNQVLGEVSPELARAKKDNQELRSKTEVDMRAVSQLAKNSVKGDGIRETQARLHAILANTEKTKSYHDKVSDLLETAPNLDELPAMRARVDNIVAQHGFQSAINSAAYTYAMSTAKREMKADPYALASFHNALDLNKAIRLKQMDHEIWLDHQERLGNLGKPPGQSAEELLALARSKGITMEQLANEGIDYTNIADKNVRPRLLKLGLFGGDNAQGAPTFASPTEAPVYDPVQTYHDNVRITSEATTKAHNMSASYLKELVFGMRKEYQKASANPDTKAGEAVRNKIVSDAGEIFQGTGIDVDNLLFGTNPVNFLTIRNLGEAMARAGELRSKDPSGRVYTSSLPDDVFVQTHLANQVAKGLLNERSKALKEAVDRTISAIPFDGDERRYGMEGAAYMALLGGEGVKPRLEAIVEYGRLAGKYYKGGAGEAMVDFRSKYDDYLTNFTKNLRSLNSRAGFQDEGGSVAVAGSVQRQVDGDMKFSTAYGDFQRLARDVMKTSLEGQVDAGPGSLQLASSVLRQFAANDTKDLSLTVRQQFVPGSNQVLTHVVVQDDKIVRKALGLKTTDPITEEMRDFTITSSSELPALRPFVSRINPAPSDVYMQSEGAILSVDVPGKGGGSIIRSNGVLSGEAYAYDFDENTGEMRPDPVRIPSPPLREGISIEEAVRQIKHGVDEFDTIAQAKKLRYLNRKRQQNAGATN